MLWVRKLSYVPGSARIYCKGSTTKVTTDQSESILPKDNKPQDQGRTSDTTGLFFLRSNAALICTKRVN